MKNDYCPLNQNDIHTLIPEKYKPFLLSPFQYSAKNGVVQIPEDVFREMIEIITQHALEQGN